MMEITTFHFEEPLEETYPPWILHGRLRGFDIDCYRACLKKMFQELLPRFLQTNFFLMVLRKHLPKPKWTPTKVYDDVLFRNPTKNTFNLILWICYESHLPFQRTFTFDGASILNMFLQKLAVQRFIIIVEESRKFLKKTVFLISDRLASDRRDEKSMEASWRNLWTSGRWSFRKITES